MRLFPVFLAMAFVYEASVPPTALAEPPQTRVEILDGLWRMNGQITYPGTPAEGLLMNVRMVNTVFEDTGPGAERLPEDFNPDANTSAFIACIPDYVEHGVRAFTIGLQGGSPGYSGNITSAFNSDGSLRPGYIDRVRRVIEACDRHGAVVILSCFYQNQHSHDRALEGRNAILNALANVARWLWQKRFANVVLEIANEPHVSGFRQWQDSEWMQSDEGQVEMIQVAREAHPSLLVATGGTGTGRVRYAVAEASDFILIHFNNTQLQDIPARIEALRRYNKSIVCNEDDKTGEEGTRAAELCVAHGASWGFMHKEKNQFTPFEYEGAKDDPLVYTAIKRLTTATSAARTPRIPILRTARFSGDLHERVTHSTLMDEDDGAGALYHKESGSLARYKILHHMTSIAYAPLPDLDVSDRKRRELSR